MGIISNVATPFPITLGNSGKCSGFFAKQASDSIVLNTYYSDGLNNIQRPCKKLPLSNKLTSNCFYKVPGSKNNCGLKYNKL